ncbi:hypothetical protein HanXRQr2_Chr06g0270221 [Helianthus annuus]|uniref:Uncharacterized protein n=1 Tax=Helianthus annuus TaxID=4232 RepID=A0A9K3NL13_HELAN|nr:hypothetical protein HanXRQr2_Chr06g0270221 [Helianthus annuus]KAJ0916366.1 hypothetical protein HanPSC8_Chr06g0260811 [Helianthus annuus]
MLASCVHGWTHPVWKTSGSKVEESMNEVVRCVCPTKVMRQWTSPHSEESTDT